ncbi:MAG: HlyD family efflux transporter periplasmic adaptor subunit [Hyphomicrobiaceae bacterium]
MRRHLFRLVSFAAAAMFAAWAFYHYQRDADAGWQGWIEGEFLFVAADEAGRLVSRYVEEGQTIQAGDPLFKLESDLQAAELEQATSALAEARARLSRLQAAQQRPEEVAVLHAQRERVEASLEQSEKELRRAKDLTAKGVASQARLDAAVAVYAQNQAALTEITRQIQLAGLSARSEEIEAARAVVGQAQSRVATARIMLDRRQVKAPAVGVVQETYYDDGEVVPAGRSVLSLLPVGKVKILFYVPESALSSLEPGARVIATCDGCARPIAATVRFISTEAEYTPPVIFSKEERGKLVFRVEASPDDPRGLTVGLPVTVAGGEEIERQARAQQ